MPKAIHSYNIEIIWEFMDDRGLTYNEVAIACGVSIKHVSDVLNGRTVTAKTKTKKKFIDGFRALGMGAGELQSLFITRT